MRDNEQIPPGVTADLFEKWRSPKRGTGNPESMNNPVWEWLIKTRLSAYQANALLNGPPSTQAGPCWCFDRFGQSRTELPDGHVALIGGEHEDYYDADFYIYNDLVLTGDSAPPEIYGYPLDAFPATDFHSATLIDKAVLLIGNLGYPEHRQAGTTQVLCLDLQTLGVSNIESTGDNPGWIHDHTATLTDDGSAILVRGGKVDLCDGTSLIENIDDWHLNVGTWRWERLSTKAWPRFEICRMDRKPNHLWQLRQLVWSQSVGWDDVEKWSRELTEELGSPPRPDIVPSLYSPGIADEIYPSDVNEHNVFRIRIGDIVVRYVEDTFAIQVTVEGQLPAVAIQTLKEDLMGKFESLEKAPAHCRDIPAL